MYGRRRGGEGWGDAWWLPHWPSTASEGRTRSLAPCEAMRDPTASGRASGWSIRRARRPVERVVVVPHPLPDVDSGLRQDVQPGRELEHRHAPVLSVEAP